MYLLVSKLKRLIIAGQETSIAIYEGSGERVASRARTFNQISAEIEPLLNGLVFKDEDA